MTTLTPVAALPALMDSCKPHKSSLLSFCRFAFGPKAVDRTNNACHWAESCRKVGFLLGYVILECLLGTQLFLTLQEMGSTRRTHFWLTTCEDSVLYITLSLFLDSARNCFLNWCHNLCPQEILRFVNQRYLNHCYLWTKTHEKSGQSLHLTFLIRFSDIALICSVHWFRSPGPPNNLRKQH